MRRLLASLVVLAALAVAVPARAGSQTFTASDPAWSWPTGITTLDIVACYGGGGGSGGVSALNAAGGGGGGATYSATANVAKVEATLAVVVGSGGSAGVASNGGVGGTSLVTQGLDTICAAPGGDRGLGGSLNNTNYAGGAVSAAGEGDVTYTGGSGSTGSRATGVPGGAGGGGAGSVGIGGNASGETGGTAGGGLASAGSNGVADSTAGVAGPPAGAGASGGKTNSATDRDGAQGGAGLVYIEWTDAATGPKAGTTASMGAGR